MVIGASGDPLSIRADLLVLPINAAGTVGSDAGRLLRRRFPTVWAAIVGDLADTGARPGALVAIPAAAGPAFALCLVRERARDIAQVADLRRVVRTIGELLRARPRFRLVSIAPLVREGDEWTSERMRDALTRELGDIDATVYAFVDDEPLPPRSHAVRLPDYHAAAGLHIARLDDLLRHPERR